MVWQANIKLLKPSLGLIKQEWLTRGSLYVEDAIIECMENTVQLYRITVINQFRFLIGLFACFIRTHSTRAHFYFVIRVQNSGISAWNKREMKNLSTVVCKDIKHLGIVWTLEICTEALSYLRFSCVLLMSACFITEHSTRVCFQFFFFSTEFCFQMTLTRAPFSPKTYTFYGDAFWLCVHQY